MSSVELYRRFINDIIFFTITNHEGREQLSKSFLSLAKKRIFA
jgi:hypothetical protein